MPTRRRPGWPRVCVVDLGACDDESVVDGQSGARRRLCPEFGPAGVAGRREQRTAADRAPGAGLVANRRRVEEPAHRTDRARGVPAEPAGDVRLRRRGSSAPSARTSSASSTASATAKSSAKSRRAACCGHSDSPATRSIPFALPAAAARTTRGPNTLGPRDSTSFHWRSSSGSMRRASSRPGINRAGRGRSST